MADLKMDEATRKSLLGLMPFTQGGTIMFVPECMANLPEEFQSSLKLRSLNRQEFNEVRELYSNDKIENKQDPLWAISRKAVLGWNKVFDLATGEPISFKADPDGGIDKDSWEMLPLVIRREIATTIFTMSGLIYEERVALKS
jgi:hypothetical protein